MPNFKYMENMNVLFYTLYNKTINQWLAFFLYAM